MHIISVYDAGVITRVKLADDDPDIVNLVDYAIGRGFGVHVAKVSIKEVRTKLTRDIEEMWRVNLLLQDVYNYNYKIIKKFI